MASYTQNTFAYKRIFAQIDLDAAKENMDHMYANLRPGTMMAAVIKTNAYGHGAVPMAHKLESLDYLWGFAVATFEEGRELREAGITKPIMILGHCFPYCYEEIARLELRPAVFREDTLALLSQAAESVGKNINIHIAVDTGMSRIGISPDKADDSGFEFVKKALATDHLTVEGIFTHFAKADMINGIVDTEQQYERFEAFTRRIETELSVRIPMIHCSNSASIVCYQDSTRTVLNTANHADLVRAGITLYGMWPSDEVPKDILSIKPVLSLYSHITFIKDIEEGVEVGYGGTFKATKPTTIATIPVGYGDGYPRSLSGKGFVYIKGHKVPIVGRVCMDQLMVDITGFDDIKEDDLVTLVGWDGREDENGFIVHTEKDPQITAEELGELSGRFNYELTCLITQRVPRVYVGL